MKHRVVGRLWGVSSKGSDTYKNMSSHERPASLHTSPSLISNCYLPPPQLRKRIQEGPAAESCSADASETMPHANELDITSVGPVVTLPAALDPRAQAVDTSAEAQSDMTLALHVQSISVDGLSPLATHSKVLASLGTLRKAAAQSSTVRSTLISRSEYVVHSQSPHVV